MAEALLRVVSTDSGQQAENTAESSQSLRSIDGSQPTAPRAKRAQVTAACRSCREKKLKCDGLRPCAPCTKRGLSCQYETLRGETRPQASKRRYEEISQSHEAYAELFSMLGNGSERDSTEILRRIRRGHQPDAVLRYMKTSGVAIAVTEPSRLAIEAFLINLAHSTGSLQEVLDLAMLTLDPAAGIRLPNSQTSLTLRNRIVRLPVVNSLLQRTEHPGSGVLGPWPHDGSTVSLNVNTRSSISTRADPLAEDGADEDRDERPPHSVPASPWTTITDSDDAVSHLVSLYFAWINPTWRFVEQDLFLQGMCSERLDSDLCSPFLVNSICAIASIHSEHDVAFVPQFRDRVSRGQHFHDEALRLWRLEENRPTITNMQALCVLSLESNYRAEDRFGLTLVPIAMQLDKEVPLHNDEKRCANQGITEQDYARLRLSAHWAVVCTDVIMCIAFMSGTTSDSHLPGVAKIHDVFDDRFEWWIAYPLSMNAVVHRPTLYLQERCRLAGLFQEMHDLILASGKEHGGGIREFAGAVECLAGKMEHWYQHLPFELHYEWPMSVAVWELHASYLAFLMIPFLVARSRFQQKEEPRLDRDSSTDADGEEANFRVRIAQSMFENAITLAHTAAQHIRDFRMRYGLKITPAWLLQLQAVTAGVLILDPELANVSIGAYSGASDDQDEAIHDSRSAFDEIFRSLLGTGVEVMIARGVARMMYHTALEQNIVLSQSTSTMLKIMSDTAWRPSDLSKVNSVLPNFATTKGCQDRERITELLSKWEKLDI